MYNVFIITPIADSLIIHNYLTTGATWVVTNSRVVSHIYTHTYIYYIFARMYIIKRLYVYSCSCSCNRRSCAKSRSGLLPDYACVKSPCLCVNQI